MALETPVALIIFKRADLTAQVFEAIRRARPRRLFVIADGPRDESERARCAAARAVIDVDWDCELVTDYSEVNLGCKRRIVSGIDRVFEQCEEAIILEDDTLPSPSFFGFCHELLARWRGDLRIMNIAGTNLHPHPYPATRPETYFFARYGITWGWATWRRAWKQLDVTLADWPAFKRAGRMRNLFASRREQLYWTLIFDAVHRGQLDSAWDYQWLFARLRNSGLSAVPALNLVSNLGFRDDATHTRGGVPGYIARMQRHELPALVHPIDVVPDLEVDRSYFAETFNLRGLAGLALSGLRRAAQPL